MSKHSLLPHLTHVPKSLRQATRVGGHQILVSLTSSLRTLVPCFCADFFGVLPQ